MAHWFIKCLKPTLTLKKLNLTGKAKRIYNVDESGFPLSWTPKMILTRRGQKNTTGTSSRVWSRAGHRENLRVRFRSNSPPYVVYKGARVSPYKALDIERLKMGGWTQTHSWIGYKPSFCHHCQYQDQCCSFWMAINHTLAIRCVRLPKRMACIFSSSLLTPPISYNHLMCGVLII